MGPIIIGDVHGKFDEYLDIARSSEYTIQVGDFGFSKTWNALHYSGLDPLCHKIIGGNHEDYDVCPQSAHYLGNYGFYELGPLKFFFYRGGLSIDRAYRIGEELSGSKKTWWSDEELNFSQMLEVIKLFKKIKPDIVISHVPPEFIINDFKSDHNILVRYKFSKTFRENTGLLGNELFKIHKPKIWVSGHHHTSYANYYDGMLFRGLAELETFRIGDFL